MTFNNGYQSHESQTINTQAAYAYDRVQRVTVGRAYAEMTVGIVITALVAMFSYNSGLLLGFVSRLGTMGMIILLIVQFGIVITLSAAVNKFSVPVARTLFYAYAAITGFTLSSIFYTYNLGSVLISFSLAAGFFFVLTMLSLTTKVNMLKAGPILFVALIVFVIGQIILSFFATPASSMLVAGIGLVLFAGLTAYDAQKTRQLLSSTSGDIEQTKRLSIYCALSLYLDFVNMFLYLLRIFGDRD
ncbi:MAG: Bax inhibitor-1/YccA family protein [Bifidobacteriaceae bacterium]|nr:Bax inhibitor-1/YccA family protein [Bifidobacteriaceae bacterium]